MKAWVTLVYALLVLAGGIMGYRKASSQASLISGTLFGLALLAAAILMLRGSAAGATAAMVLAVVLLLFFGYRLVTGGKFMPAGLMVVVSLVELAVLYWAPD